MIPSVPTAPEPETTPQEDSNLRDKTGLEPRQLRLIAVVCLAVAAAILLLVGFAGCGRGKGKPGPGAAKQVDNATAVSVVVAQRGTIQDELELTGTCQATDQVDVVSEASGKVIAVTRDVGDVVRAGELLVQLDTALVSRQRVQAERGVDSAASQLRQSAASAKLTDKQTSIGIRQADAGLAAARQQLQKSQASYKYTTDKVHSDIEQAKVALASAQAQQRDVAAGARTQELAQAEASVRTAESTLSLRKTDYERYQRLYQQGAVAEATLDSYRTQYEVAQQAVTQAREALSLAREGSRQEQKRVASLAVDRAQEQLRLAEAGRRQVEIAARDLEVARVSLRQAEESLRLAYASRGQYDVAVAGVNAARAGVGQAVASKDYARTSEGKYSIFSPISGVVASRSVDVGEGAASGTSVMRIVNANPIRLEANVTELDIDKVKLGDEGLTTVDGLPGKTFVGRVAAITPQAQKDQRNYIVRLEVDNAEGLIKAGMFARVKLVTAEKNDVVVVDRDCVVEQGANRLLYVVENGVVKIRKAELGITNASQMEITSGLRAGEMLVCTSQATLADGQAVKPVQKSDQPGTADAEAGATQGAETQSVPAAPAAGANQVISEPAPAPAAPAKPR